MSNSFFNNDEDTSLERGSPVKRTMTNLAKTSVKQLQQTADATAKDFLNQLYGPSDHQGQDASTDNSHASQQGSSTLSSQLGLSADVTRSPEEQAKLEGLRRELSSKYTGKYQSVSSGVHNITTDLDQEMEKARQERKQQEEERKRAEEEEEQRKKEEKMRRQQEAVVAPAGKKTGMQMGKKQQQPMAVQLEKTKAESNRGTTG